MFIWKDYNIYCLLKHNYLYNNRFLSVHIHNTFFGLLIVLYGQQACIGTFGLNCSGGPCKEGYYGFGCLSKCYCSTHQQCDRIRGCIESKGDT